MKSAIPWILIVALLAGVYFLYSSNREKDGQLAKLTQENSEVEQLRAQIEDLKKQSIPPDEIARLRKNNDEVLRLRNEAQRMGDQAKQLSSQLAGALAQGSQARQAQAQLSKLATENEALRGQTEKTAQLQAQVNASIHDACVNNLRQIAAAKQSWALENKKAAADTPTSDDLLPYLSKQSMPTCPGGGTYSINAVNTLPVCNIPGHTLE